MNRKRHPNRSKKNGTHTHAGTAGEDHPRKKRIPRRPQKNSKKLRRRKSDSREQLQRSIHRKRGYKPRKKQPKFETINCAKKDAHKTKKARKAKPKRKAKEVEYVWVKKKKSNDAEKAVETRERVETFNSSNTKDTTDERIPNVDALAKMLELQEKFEKRPQPNPAKGAFDKILDSRYSNSSIKTCSIVSDSERKFDPPTPEKAKVKLVVDLSEIRRKLDFESNSVQESPHETETRSICGEDNEDEFDFILKGIRTEEEGLQLETEEFESEPEQICVEDFAGEPEKNGNVDSDSDSWASRERFQLRIFLREDTCKGGSDSKVPLETYSLEKTFLKELFEKEAFLEQDFENYVHEQKAQEQLIHEEEPVEDLSGHLRENGYFSEYLRGKKVQREKNLGRLNKYICSFSKKALLKRNSLIKQMCAMRKIDSLFSPTEQGKPEPAEKESPREARVEEEEKGRPEQKKFRETIWIRKCPDFFRLGVCLKGEHCSRLHIAFHSQYSDLRRCVVNMLKSLSNKHAQVSLQNLLNNFNKMKPALDIFSKIMYRKPEISIFDEIFDEYHQMF